MSTCSAQTGARGTNSGSTRPHRSPGHRTEESLHFDEDDIAIHIARLSAANERPLIDGNEPAWSPCGNQIAFQWRGDGDLLRIFVIGVDGKGEHQLTQGGGIYGDTEPAWSPDGKRIAFVSDRDGDEEIEVMNADGTGRMQLTHNDIIDWHPTWSPDGESIAFVRFAPQDDPDNNLILVMNADGSGERKLAEGSNTTELDWQPTPR
jgi:Tol biopolymer transport system component